MIKDQSGLEEETKDPDRYNAINFKQPKKHPRTLDELDKDPDFQLLLDVPTFKVLLGRLQWLKLPEFALAPLLPLAMMVLMPISLSSSRPSGPHEPNVSFAIETKC